MTATAEAAGPGLPPRSPEEAAARRLASVPTAPKPASPIANGGAIRIREAAPETDAPREPLFYIEHADGTETAWTIPVVAPEYVWVNALAITATRGGGVAEVYMMQEMLGDGWAALLASKAMTRDNYRQMVTAVRDKVIGPQEADPNR